MKRWASDQAAILARRGRHSHQAAILASQGRNSPRLTSVAAFMTEVIALGTRPRIAAAPP